MINLKNKMRDVGVFVGATIFLSGFYYFIANPSIKKAEEHERKLNSIYKESIIVNVKGDDSLDKFAMQYANDCNCGLDYREIAEKIRERNNLPYSAYSSINIQKLKIPAFKKEYKK